MQRGRTAPVLFCILPNAPRKLHWMQSRYAGVCAAQPIELQCGRLDAGKGLYSNGNSAADSAAVNFTAVAS